MGLATTAKGPLLQTQWWLLLGLMLFGLVACASDPKVVTHAFSFDARWNSPEAEILNYKYGNSIVPGARVPDSSLKEGKIPQQASLYGALPQEDSLYVKWRIKATGTTYEETVDLKSRLPNDISGQRIYFIIEGTQLYVYLISISPIRGYLSKEEHAEAKREAVTPRQKALFGYIRYKISTIYPDKSTNQETQ